MSQENRGNTGRIAAAVARIAKGAATSGPAGAAAGAISSFLPEMFKIGAVFILLSLLIPLLIFVGVPHTVFGYNSTVYTDIVQLTDKAEYMDTVYMQFKDYIHECIESLIAQILSLYVNGFDEVNIESQVGNMNTNWLIAISSVAHKQDLYEMDESSVKNLVFQMLVYSALLDEVISSEVDEDTGEDIPIIIRILTISISDLNPEALMDKLNFTDEEKYWAQLLYQTLEGEVLTGGGRYSGGYTVPPEALSDERFAKMIEEGEKYLGFSYVWGGSSPETGFDCSGYICWIINESGVGIIGRTTAQGLFNMCTPVSEENLMPGDLVFFHSTYTTKSTVTHVGLYVGDRMMLHCGDPIRYSSIDTTYWQSHFYAYGRF